MELDHRSHRGEDGVDRGGPRASRINNSLEAPLNDGWPRTSTSKGSKAIMTSSIPETRGSKWIREMWRLSGKINDNGS